jgi:hypothetical protein
MSTVSHGNPVRAISRAVNTSPNDNHVPTDGWPAANAALTGFFFIVLNSLVTNERGQPLAGFWSSVAEQVPEMLSGSLVRYCRKRKCQ